MTTTEKAIAAYLAGDVAGVQAAYSHVSAVLDDMLSGVPYRTEAHNDGTPACNQTDSTVTAVVKL